MSDHAANVLESVGDFEARIIAERFRRCTERVEEARKAVRVAAAERRELILELRDRGWSLRRIADLVGVSTTTIHQIVQPRKKG
ncbi:helix-turn-helix domain-containing protein [Mycobacteroides abscessus]|uniref:helix-turn-helix domain-containing protein n=1 Tax=Mycobacteroides abscessus TaxID=36809 RepID=UPI0007F94645|nr:helix-turn-helix domain-containing protein [Mycobacteroides abscessus]ANO12782.1 hypothetical protein BAB77_01975 [Mycobacteroides abscessus]ARQ63034.1 helix-turn-helix domain containing protein [Mycobacteroides abscessus subsp. massiliense]MBE5447553.1 hypothetical protein [Mycobacteroides abscessus]MBE5514174.1 hypothetical protein [Mycobacteroides abscessus]MBN7511796.1 helix-turn-helix domain-containing protein [Mycobacteroides abscessus subsp. massiliense]